MRLIVDTDSGLATVEERADFKHLDAVVIGTGPMPDYVGVGDSAHIWVYVALLERLLTLQADADIKAFQAMLEFARSKRWSQITAMGEQVRVHVAERIAA